MEQLRHVGEVVGGMKAMMVFKDDIHVNQRQCCFILDAFTLAFETISEEMRRSLRFEYNQTTWKALEHPLKELYRISREAEAYIKHCFETKDWWAKALIMYQNRDCVELHVHNLMSCVSSVMEAIEGAAELSGWSRKYQYELNDPILFRWKFGKQLLVTTEICNRIDSVWKEDRWCLLDKIREKKIPTKTKHAEQLTDLLLKNLDSSDDRILPCSVLLGCKDYQVRRRLGMKGEYKEISWLGESFVLRQIKMSDAQCLVSELLQLLSLSHPNVLQILCGFKDDEKNECFTIAEMMNKDLGTHIKEFYSPRKRVPLSLSVVVDIMLQIARGMEYLHSKKIFHGDLKPSNVLLKMTGSAATSQGYVHAKVTKIGLSSVSKPSQKNPAASETAASCIWHAPEVLAAQEESRRDSDVTHVKCTEKSDMYSFGMICFELLSGKPPSDDAHLQGEKMSRNIRAGERPLFPSHCPKFLINITKKCWHADPNQRPTFSSVCRVLRYIKRFLSTTSSDQTNTDGLGPIIDYFDLDSSLAKKFPSWTTGEALPVSEIPFQMFAYRITEKERCTPSFRDTYESGSEAASMSGDEHAAIADDPFIITIGQERVPPARRSLDAKPIRYPGTLKGRILRPPHHITRNSRSLQSSPDNRVSHESRGRWRKSGHASDSELS